jgi:hypothetical protein
MVTTDVEDVVTHHSVIAMSVIALHSSSINEERAVESSTIVRHRPR